MNPKARRTNMETLPLPLHDERSVNNKPYVKFEIGNVNPEPKYHGENGDRTWWWGVSSEEDAKLVWDNLHAWYYFQNSDNQKNGYRIPNQRELLIMSTRLPITAWPTYSVEVHWYEGAGGGSMHTKIITEQPPYYISQTSFSLNGQSPYNDDNREGFLWRTDGDVFMLQNSRNEQGYVRLIKDIAE